MKKKFQKKTRENKCSSISTRRASHFLTDRWSLAWMRKTVLAGEKGVGWTVSSSWPGYGTVEDAKRLKISKTGQEFFVNGVCWGTSEISGRKIAIRWIVARLWSLAQPCWSSTWDPSPQTSPSKLGVENTLSKPWCGPTTCFDGVHHGGRMLVAVGRMLVAGKANDQCSRGGQRRRGHTGGSLAESESRQPRGALRHSGMALKKNVGASHPCQVSFRLGACHKPFFSTRRAPGGNTLPTLGWQCHVFTLRGHQFQPRPQRGEGSVSSLSQPAQSCSRVPHRCLKQCPVRLY